MPRRTRPLAAALVAAMVTLPSCASGGSGGGDGDGAAAPAPACRPDDGAAGEHVVLSGGLERRYLLAVPASAPGPNGLPLIVDFHGFGGSADEHEADTGLAARGAVAGYAVATPDGLGEPRRWNFDRRPGAPDDYAFVDDLVADVADRACVDTDRVHLVGSSNGAAFVGLFACTGRTPPVAVAMVIATVPPTCEGEPQPAILTIRGDADTHVPYPGTPDLVAGWAGHDGCATPPRDSEPYPGVTRTAYGGCAGGVRVVLDTVAGGTHAWPGGPGARSQGDNSPAGVGYPATEAVLAFFAEVDAATASEGGS